MFEALAGHSAIQAYRAQQEGPIGPLMICAHGI